MAPLYSLLEIMICLFLNNTKQNKIMLEISRAIYQYEFCTPITPLKAEYIYTVQKNGYYTEHGKSPKKKKTLKRISHYFFHSYWALLIGAYQRSGRFFIMRRVFV
jgi:hypothetical protein